MNCNLKFLIFIGNALKEFNSNESNGESFICIQGVEIGLDYDVTLPIYVKNGEWVAVKNKEVSFYEEDKEIQTCIIGTGVLLKIKINGVSKSIHVMSIKLDTSYMSFKKFFLPNGKEVTIGRDKENGIVYKNTGVSRLHAKILKDNNGNFLFTCIKEGRTHLNGISIKSGVVTVKFGDEINIMGLKIIILDGFIIINNPEDKMACSCPPADRMYLDEKVIEKSSGNITYAKTPRLLKHLKRDTVEIEMPPPPVLHKNQPLIYLLGPSIIMVIAMFASIGMSVYFSSSSSNPATMVTSGVMALSMLLGSILWPILNTRYQKKTAAKEENLRVTQYTEYIKRQIEEISEKVEWNRNVMLDMHPEPGKIINRVVNGSRKIWERTHQDEDFLDTRIGLGEQKNFLIINAAKENFSMTKDPLKEEPGKLQEKFNKIQDMPVIVPLTKDVVVGIIGKRRERTSIVNNMLIQLAGLHSYDELKIVLVCNESQKNEFEWVKSLPHVWSSDKAVRFFATNKEETHEVFNNIDEIMRAREENKREGHQKSVVLPYFAVFIMDCKLVEDEISMRYLADYQNNLSISTVFVADTIGMLPSGCQTIIQYDDETCSIFNKERKEDGELPFKADVINREDILNFSKSISSYNLKSIGGNQNIPSALDFLGMFMVGNVKSLDIGRRWQGSQPHKSLAAPIGVKAGGELFSLNIHEKYHGPHGLVAGMTGSGKSEFIQAYILSMAINFHPHDVSFILIDYKGGGMANSFKGLPHISGIITNLEGNQIRRSLISINAELKRRQHMFDMAGVKHIDEYQVLYKDYLKKGPGSKSRASIPLPHLVIVSDEFAELKTQQPEFMDKLVSAARIGRSLGVHLILATQKPSGVVNEQIWSNSRFRVCLKVLDRQDSQDMLKRPEAAAITLPGRGYVQVGYNEIFECVQSGYSGLRYTSEDEYADPEAQKVIMIDNCAKKINSVSIKKSRVSIKRAKSVLRGKHLVRTMGKKSRRDLKKTQLTAVVDYINNYSRNYGIYPIKLWAEQLKEVVSLEEINMLENSGFDGFVWREPEEWMSPIVGIVDDPENQRQYPLKLEIGKKGHIILYGMPGTGKTTFIQTLVYSIAQSYSPEDAAFYMLDFGGRTLGFFSELPHCLGVAFTDDQDKVENIFKSVMQELNFRKNKFALSDVGNIHAYKSATGEKIPAILLVLDSYSVFHERFGELEDIIVTIAREGANYGIYLVITGSDKSAVYYKITDYVKQFLTLQMTDKTSYMEILGQTFGLEPEPVKGRGLVKLQVPLEFQTALAVGELDEAERTKKLRDIFKNMRSAWASAGKDSYSIAESPEPFIARQEIAQEEVASASSVVKGFNPVANVVREINPIINYDINSFYSKLSNDCLPLAWNMKSGNVEVMNLRNPTPFYIGGLEGTGKTNMVMQIAKTLKRQPGSRVYVYEGDSGLMKNFCEVIGVDSYMDDGQAFDAFLGDFIKEINQRLTDRRKYRDEGGNRDEEYAFMSKYDKVFILIDGFDGFHNAISNKSVDRLLSAFSLALQNLNIYFITAESPDISQKYSLNALFDKLIKTGFGILLGGNVRMQEIAEFEGMKASERERIFEAGQGYLYRDKTHVLSMVPLSE